MDVTKDMFGSGKHWMRHTASVPKGFLRYYVLKILKEKPMSGSELMEEIEKQMGGRWRPSPGSIYPLLAWLQDSGYVKELPKEEGGIKRYSLTEQGEKFFEEQTKFREDVEKKMEFFAPPFFPPFLPGFWRGAHHEAALKLQEPARRVIKALFDLGLKSDGRLDQKTLKEVENILNDTAKRIEELAKKLEEEKKNE